MNPIAARLFSRRSRYAMMCGVVLGVVFLPVYFVVRRAVNASHRIRVELRGTRLTAYEAGGISSLAQGSLPSGHIISTGRRSVLVFIRDGCSHCLALEGSLRAKLSQPLLNRISFVYAVPPRAVGAQQNSFLVGERLADRMGIHLTPTSILLGPEQMIDQVYVGDGSLISSRLETYLNGGQTEVGPALEEQCAKCLVK